MSRQRSKSGKDTRDSGAFLAIPLSVIQSRAFKSLSVHGKALLIDLASQYRGENNGDFSAAWKLMKPCGWRSEETLAKAKRELLNTGLIVVTRHGARPNKTTLYAVTWWALDYCKGKLEMTAREYPRGKYKFFEGTPFPPPRLTQKNTPVTTRGVVAEGPQLRMA